MKAVEESMKARIDANQEKIDDGQRKMKAQMASLAYRIDVNQEEMIAEMDVWTVGTEACVGKLDTNRESRMP
jgi:uncharacterized NAD-dependent epimerase/dehydratase family protein